MTTISLKKKIYHCIENIDDNKLLEAVYTILNGHVVNDEFELSSDDIGIIEKRKKATKNGLEKTYSVSEVKKKILKNIGK